MEGNIVTQTIHEIVKEKYRGCMFGKFNITQDKATLDENDRGGVYGIAVKLHEGETAEELYNKIKATEAKMSKKIQAKDWKTIGEDYYPLYWGKDSDLGFRLHNHASGGKRATSIELAKRGLQDYTVIYGAVFCTNKKECETNLHNMFPDILKNIQH